MIFLRNFPLLIGKLLNILVHRPRSIWAITKNCKKNMARSRTKRRDWKCWKRFLWYRLSIPMESFVIGSRRRRGKTSRMRLTICKNERQHWYCSCLLLLSAYIWLCIDVTFSECSKMYPKIYCRIKFQPIRAAIIGRHRQTQNWNLVIGRADSLIVGRNSNPCSSSQKKDCNRIRSQRKWTTFLSSRWL